MTQYFWLSIYIIDRSKIFFDITLHYLPSLIYFFDFAIKIMSSIYLLYPLSPTSITKLLIFSTLIGLFTMMISITIFLPLVTISIKSDFATLIFMNTSTTLFQLWLLNYSSNLVFSKNVITSWLLTSKHG